MDCRDTRLSIIIPVYNTEKLLGKCLDSVLAAIQKLDFDVEILLINDGSTDRSKVVIANYKEQYPQYIKAFDKPNGGLSDVKNFGLEHAKGEFISFIDSDDFVEPEMYEDMMGKLLTESADAAICDIKLVYDDGSERIWSCINAPRATVYEEVIDMPMMASSCNKIIRRGLFTGMRFPTGINNEDIAVTPIVLGYAEKIVAINKPYYNYYQRSGSIQNGEFNERRFALLETAKLCVDQAQNLKKEKQEIIKNSLYAHQILALALYPIREQKFAKRQHLLKIYMNKVNQLFPDFWENEAVRNYGQKDGKKERLFKQISVMLLKHRWYMLTCCFWSGVNRLQKL